MIDEPGGRARAPGEGAVAPRGNLGQPGAFPAPLERRVREAGPAGGWFGWSYISHRLGISAAIGTLSLGTELAAIPDDAVRRMMKTLPDMRDVSVLASFRKRKKEGP